MIVLATTTLAVLRLPAGLAAGDLYDVDATENSADYQPIATGVRAHISDPTGTELLAGGEESDVLFPFSCDPTDLVDTDRVKDETTNQMYAVVWARTHAGYDLGSSYLEHVAGRLRQVRGETSR